MNKEFDEALQYCLDLIRGGRETIDSVVALYPEYADELRSQLEIAAWLTSASSALDPRPGFVSASRRRLVSRIQQENRVPTPVPLTWGERLQQFLSTQKIAPVAFVFILMLALFVSGAVVSASQKALPGDDLYSVKITLEQIALAASIDEKNDAELQIQMVENRFTEMRTLIVTQNFDEVPETIQESTKQISKAVESIKTVNEQDSFLATELAGQLSGILEEQKSILEILVRSTPSNVSANFYKVWAASDIAKLNFRVADITSIVPPPPQPPPSLVPTVAPTSTPKPRPTLAPTQPPAPTATRTRKPPTAVPPTNTPKPTNTPVPPTNTPVPPTNTPKPTNTQVPPTNTPVPPTNTPLPTNTLAPTATPLATNPPPTSNPPTSTATPVTVSDSTVTPTP